MSCSRKIAVAILVLNLVTLGDAIAAGKFDGTYTGTRTGSGRGCGSGQITKVIKDDLFTSSIKTEAGVSSDKNFPISADGTFDGTNVYLHVYGSISGGAINYRTEDRRCFYTFELKKVL